jgi:PKD repeat protein
MIPDTLQIDLNSEQVLMKGAPCSRLWHNGGALAFGNDGLLYVTTGDGGGDSLKSSQDRTNLHGSIIRLQDDGSVPLDNPFSQQSGHNGVRCGLSGGVVPPGSASDAVCSEIYAYGFRNPFRIAMDPNEKEKVKFYVGDVGDHTWEEINEAGTDYAGKNYGWPLYEGPCERGSTTDCAEPDTRFVDPSYYYVHRSRRGGGAVVGSAFVPQGIWPSQYNYLFIDFIFLEIYNLIQDDDRTCRECRPPIPGFRNETFHRSFQDPDLDVNNARMVDMFFGPYKNTQALYVFKHGDSANVRRIRFTGNVNRPPVPIIQVQEKSVGLGETITFDGSGSYDEEGEALTFRWDFGDGSASFQESPQHSYSAVGQYTVTLIVVDEQDQAQQASTTIEVGGLPTATILSPAQGKQFYSGEILQLFGEAKDSSGDALDESQIEWEVRKHHADHFHPFLDQTSGNDFDLFPAPEPEDFFAATNSFLEIIMYATDESGLTAKISLNVFPSLVFVNIDSSPQGLKVFVDDNPVITPDQITSWANHKLHLRTENQPPYSFASWSDGGSRSHSIQLVENSQPSVLVTFCKDNRSECSSFTECCSGRCVLGECRSSSAPGADRDQRLGDDSGRGGAAGRNRRDGGD